METHESLTESIFFAALDRPSAEERAAYVAAACKGDDELRQRVERLLAFHPRLGSFLQAPAAVAFSPTLLDVPLAEGPGDVIGPYTLLEQIGEGGFGIVFMAEQTAPVRRKVALKVIKPGMDTRQVIARFEAERQALAMMDHPNIAKVLDAGATETGRPYFVMELVRGAPITEYCDRAQLTPRERLDLFVTVCHAVQHAHQKGIIHRDIKPTNVLVSESDDRPLVKVIDFGIAKAMSGQLTDKTMFTGYAQVVGTPLYMSPEQAALSAIDVDTRSDIYSLGVLLYELLTGTTPFDRTRLQAVVLDEIRRIIREEEPEKPSTRLSSLGETMASVSAVRRMEPRQLSRLVRGDLDWIVMKSLEKERARRYETASGFAADVLRYLADEPVTASPPSAAYRLRKFARRNRRTLVTTALLGAMLLLALGSFGWMALDRAARRGRNTETVAALLERCEDALRADREDQATLALDAAERRAADGGAEELSGRLARCRADLVLLGELNAIDTLCWTWREDGEPAAGMATTQRLPAPLSAYGVTADRGRAGEAAERVKGSLIRDRVLAALDLWLTWEPSAEIRDGLRAVLRAADPDPYRNAFRDALGARDAGEVTALSARTEALAQPARFAIIFGELADIPAERRRAVLESAIRHAAGNLALLMSLGRTYGDDTHPEARSEPLRWYQAAVAAHPRNVLAHNNLAVALAISGNRDAAMAYYRQAIRIEPTFALGHSNLGVSLVKKGDLDGAILCYREAIRLNPKDDFAHRDLAAVLLRKGDLDGAIEAYRKAIEIEPSSAAAHNVLAWTQATGPDGARDGKGAVEHATRACELTSWKAPDFIDTLAAAHAEAGNFTRAVEYQMKALEFPEFQDGEGGRKRLDLYKEEKAFRDPALSPREVPPQQPGKRVE